MASKTIAINKGMNLEFPHEVVHGSEFGDIHHADVEESVVVDMNGVGNCRRRRCFRRHGSKVLKSNKDQEEKKKVLFRIVLLLKP